MKRSNDSPSPHLPLGPSSFLLGARVLWRGGIGRILSTSQSSINLVATFSRRNHASIRFSANKVRLFAIDNRNDLTVWRLLEYSSTQHTRKKLEFRVDIGTARDRAPGAISVHKFYG